MIKKSIFFAIALTLTTGISNAGLFGPLKSLDWGASENDVMVALGQSATRRECSSILEKIADKVGEVCDPPILKTYEVFGIPFSLSTSIGKNSKRLMSASLYYAEEPDPSVSPEKNKNNWIKSFTAIIDELTRNYGKPIAESGLDRDGAIIKMIYWRRDGTEVRYDGTFLNYPTRKHESHSILYSPSVPIRDSKL